MALHADPFTDKLLHTKAFTHSRIYTQAPLLTEHDRAFYLQMLLHTDTNPFTHRWRFYTKTLLPKKAFTCFHIHALLRTNALHTDHTIAFTRRCLYTKMVAAEDMKCNFRYFWRSNVSWAQRLPLNKTKSQKEPKLLPAELQFVRKACRRRC